MLLRPPPTAADLRSRGAAGVGPRPGGLRSLTSASWLCVASGSASFYDRHVLTSVQVDDVSAWLVEAVPLAALQRVSAALMAEADDATAAELTGDAAAAASPNRRPSRLQAALDQRLMMVAEATGKRAMAEAEADAGGAPGATRRRGRPRQKGAH
eukprot:TRINITY_DN10380_c0_g1_i1.p1 TRINITY_DN10380_c0_g1~~TRINITY_DN10380_c0_g1_i1.p1  ORF type:complete len:155 (-),score=35.07 TRINITY_DN10380_c0_g1_i1:45-509(-)